MKHVRLILPCFLLYATASLTSQQDILIRPACLKDLQQITDLSTHEYSTNFKKLWTTEYSPHITLTQGLDLFIQEKIDNQKKANKEFIERHLNNEEYGVLVACISGYNQKEQIAGYCRFQKVSADTIYIHYILVDEHVRKKGIGKKLASKATTHFNGITQCRFRALIHDKTINDIYQKHGCLPIDTVALDHNTGLISTHSLSPITHVDYLFNIKD
jgi:ribosomal protein S18 acetylase RimI-like enzyme